MSIPSAPLSVGASEAECLSKEWDNYDEVATWCDAMGLTMSAKPTFAIPSYSPQEFSDLAGDGYARAMMENLAWISYLRDLKSFLDGKKLATKNEMRMIAIAAKTSASSAVGSKKLTKEELEMKVLNTPRYRELMRQEQSLDIAIMRADDKVESQLDLQKALSRQITLREQERAGSGLTPSRGAGYGNR